MVKVGIHTFGGHTNIMKVQRRTAIVISAMVLVLVLLPPLAGWLGGAQAWFDEATQLALSTLAAPSFPYHTKYGAPNRWPGNMGLSKFSVADRVQVLPLSVDLMTLEFRKI